MLLRHISRRLTTLAIGLAATIVPIAATAGPAQAMTGLTSANWAGYVKTIPSTSSKSIRGSFTVPAVTCASRTTEMAAWVGYGGMNNSSLVQAGVDARCQRGVATYSLWKEWYDPAVFSPSSLVATGLAAGDAVTLTVRQLPTNPSVYLADYTVVHAGVTRTLPEQVLARAAGSRTPVGNTMDAVVEAPTNGLTQRSYPLTNFGSMQMDLASTVKGIADASFPSDASYSVNMTTSRGTLIRASVSLGPSLTSRFTTYWHHA